MMQHHYHHHHHHHHHRRLEAIVSGDAFGACDTHSTHRHGGSDRDNKNSSSHQHNHKQLQQLQFSLQSLEQQQNASSTASKALADQLHKMEQRMQQLEVQGRTLQQQGQQLQQQLGSPAAPSRGSLQQQQQHRAAGTAYLSLLQPGSGEDNVSGSSPGLTHAGGPGSRSMAARLNKLEQRVEALAATAGSSEVSTGGKHLPCKHAECWGLASRVGMCEDFSQQ